MIDIIPYGSFSSLRSDYPAGFTGFGPKRRKLIKEFYNSNPGFALPVNNKWQQAIKYDHDLQYLIKKGFLKCIRRGAGGGRKRQTYLIKA